MTDDIVRRDSPELVPPRGHYSHVALHNGVAYIAGQLPVDVNGKPLSHEPFEDQVRQVLDNLDACLHTAGSSRDRLLSVTVYITDIEFWPAFDAIYAAWVGDLRPTRAVACVSTLHYGAAVEVQAIAATS